MPALSVQNAEIRTAAVEIKTLTVSGKQVTQAVFRQLLAARIFTHDGTLNGVPWGFVNYHLRCDPDLRHRHVVWQLGSELRRSTVYDELDLNFSMYAESTEVADRRATSHRALADLPQLFIAV